MGVILPSVAVTAGLSAALVLLLGPVARRTGLVDHPGGRKQHRYSVPLTGGVAILLAVLAGMLLAPVDGATIAPLVVGMVMLAAFGVVDDVLNINAFIKAVMQILIATLVVLWSAVEVNTLGNLLGFGGIGLGWFSTAFTVLAMVLLINAVNMLDGLDGLAGGVVFVMFAWLAAAVVLVSGVKEAMLLLLLLAALAGFLLLNMRSPWCKQARVFMGDSGSMMLGLALGWFAVNYGQGAAAVTVPVVVAWILAVPVYDMLTVMLIRLSEGRSPLAADRNHIHHFLMDAGFKSTTVVWLLVATAALSGAIGYFGWRLGIPEPALFYPWLALFFIYLVVVWRTRATRASRA